MSSDQIPLDANEYLDSLPTFVERGKGFPAEVRAWLESSLGKNILAFMEERALLLEKEFMAIPFQTPEGQMAAVELRGKISSLRVIPEILIEEANKENDNG